MAASEVRGFVVEDEKVHQATSLPANPAHLLIQLSPDKVALGESYVLEIRLVNRSNQALDATSLRLAWSLAGKKTGAPCPSILPMSTPVKARALFGVGTMLASPRERSRYLDGDLTLKDGEQLANSLSWTY